MEKSYAKRMTVAFSNEPSMLLSLVILLYIITSCSHENGTALPQLPLVLIVDCCSALHCHQIIVACQVGARQPHCSINCCLSTDFIYGGHVVSHGPFTYIFYIDKY